MSLQSHCVELNEIYFGTAKYDCVIKAREVLRFLPLNV